MKEISALLFQNQTTEEKAAERVRSVFAAIALARTVNRSQRIENRYQRTESKVRELSLSVR